MLAATRALGRTSIRYYTTAGSSAFAGRNIQRGPDHPVRFPQNRPHRRNDWGASSGEMAKKNMWVPPTALPQSATFYYGRRAEFQDSVNSLETALKHTRNVLTKLSLLPLPEFARKQLPPLEPVWRDKLAMGSALEVPLTTARYRRVVAILNQLDHCRNITRVSGHAQLASGLEAILSMFEVPNKAAYLARGKAKPTPIDDHGRAYASGRRKESSARVWVIPSKSVKPDPPAPDPPSTGRPEDEPADDVTANGLLASSPSSILASALLKSPPSATETRATASEIIINNLSLAQYFPQVADRERVVRPLKVTGLVGSFNVFALTRGGGHTGQSGAICHGLSKCLAALAPEVRSILAAAKLLKRDPRMVERKKTGLAKARKRYAWVRR